MNNLDFFGFSRVDISKLLGVNLFDNQAAHEYAIRQGISDWMLPFTSRTNLTLKEVAYLILSIKPYSNLDRDSTDVLNNYVDSLWDSVDNNELKSTNVIVDDSYGQESRVNCTLIKNEVEQWILKNKFNWPLPIHQDDNCELDYRLTNKVESSITNNNLQEDVFFLNGHHSRGLDLISIVLKEFWSTYDPGERGTSPKSSDIVNFLKENHGCSDAFAKSIDSVLRPDELKSGGRK